MLFLWCGGGRLSASAVLVQINSNNLGPIKETIWKSFKAEPAIQNTISLSICLPSTMSLPGILNYGGGPKVTVYACVH